MTVTDESRVTTGEEVVLRGTVLQVTSTGARVRFAAGSDGPFGVTFLPHTELALREQPPDIKPVGTIDLRAIERRQAKALEMTAFADGDYCRPLIADDLPRLMAELRRFNGALETIKTLASLASRGMPF